MISIFLQMLLLVLPIFLLEGHCSNESGKIGIRTDWDRVIVKCYHGCPAYYAGLRIGDKILLVDGLKSKEISGPAHETVKLLVLRNGKQLEFTVERAYESEVKIMREAAFMAEIGEGP